jgi:hypothetical protein
MGTMQRNVRAVATLVSLPIDEQLVPTLFGVEFCYTNLAEVGADGATLVIAIGAREVSARDTTFGVHDTWPLDRQWRYRDRRSGRTRL